MGWGHLHCMYSSCNCAAVYILQMQMCCTVYIAAANKEKPHHTVQKTQYRIVPMEMFQLNMSKVTRMALHRNSAGK